MTTRALVAGRIDAFVIDKFPNISHHLRWLLGSQLQSFTRGQILFPEHAQHPQVQRYGFADLVVRVVNIGIEETRYHFLYNNASHAFLVNTDNERECRVHLKDIMYGPEVNV